MAPSHPRVHLVASPCAVTGPNLLVWLTWVDGLIPADGLARNLAFIPTTVKPSPLLTLQATLKLAELPGVSFNEIEAPAQRTSMIGRGHRQEVLPLYAFGRPWPFPRPEYLRRPVARCHTWARGPPFHGHFRSPPTAVIAAVARTRVPAIPAAVMTPSMTLGRRSDAASPALFTPSPLRKAPPQKHRTRSPGMILYITPASRGRKRRTDPFTGSGHRKRSDRWPDRGR